MLLSFGRPLGRFSHAYLPRPPPTSDVIKDVFLPWYNAYRFFVQNTDRLREVWQSLCLACYLGALRSRIRRMCARVRNLVTYHIHIHNPILPHCGAEIRR